MRAEGDTVRLPSPESSLDTSRKDLLSGESVVVGSSATSGAAELAVEPAEAPWTNPESVSELSGADDPSSAGAGALGGGTESVRPLAAPEPQRRFGYRLLLADACAVETGAAAGTAPELAQVSIASVRSGASAAVPGAAVVAVASVPVEVASEGAEAQPGSFAAVPGATAVAVASVPVEVASEGAEAQPGSFAAVPGATAVAVASVPIAVASEGAELHPAASGSLPGATVVLASAPVEVGSEGAGLHPAAWIAAGRNRRRAGICAGRGRVGRRNHRVGIRRVSCSRRGVGGRGDRAGRGAGAIRRRRIIGSRSIDEERRASESGQQCADATENPQPSLVSQNSNPVQHHSAPLAMAAVVLPASDYRS